jgi:hypothetical protein
MNVTEITSNIIAGNYSNDDLVAIVEAVKFARGRLTRKVKQGLTVGDNVNFTSTKSGRNYTGTVVKIAVKFVTVRTVDGLWKVPAAMLTRIADEREFA